MNVQIIQEGVTAQRTSDGNVITFDTRSDAGRHALNLVMMRLGPKGRELQQAEAGVRMALEQRHAARRGYPAFRAGRMAAARAVLKGAIKRLRKARAPFQPIPALAPITATVRQLDPAIWGDLMAAE